MQASTHNPGTGAASAHPQELYQELRERNERRARVARLTEARREYELDRAVRVQRVLQLQRAPLREARLSVDEGDTVLRSCRRRSPSGPR